MTPSAQRKAAFGAPLVTHIASPTICPWLLIARAMLLCQYGFAPHEPGAAGTTPRSITSLPPSRQSVARAGLDPDRLDHAGPGAPGGVFNPDEQKVKAWKDIWSAGHGVGTIHDIPTVGQLVARLTDEYREAVRLPSGFV